LSKYFQIVTIVLITLSIVTSCKSKKVTEDHDKLKNKSSKELVQLLALSKFKGDWLTTKGNTEIDFQNEQNSLRFNIRIRIDSATWVSLSKASVPVATALISSDSVKLLTRMPKKSYLLADFSALNNFLNTEIDYELLEDFFLGNPIAFDYEEDYIVKNVDTAYLISSERSRKIEKLIKKGKIKDEPFLYRCWIEPENHKCQKVVINLITQETTLEVNYSDWENVGGTFFPLKSSLRVETPNDTLNMSMEYSKAEFNDPQSMPFKITDSYEQMELKYDSE
jgi:hypothetical protein